jgi:hypothetical protein
VVTNYDKAVARKMAQGPFTGETVGVKVKIKIEVVDEVNAFLVRGSRCEVRACLDFVREDSFSRTT